MSLLTYEDARPYAKAIKEKISEREMPPWHADAPAGTFLNERRISDADRETLVRWASNGSPKGDAKDLPATPTYPDGWAIGTPDVVFEMQEDYKVPADGVIEYQDLLHSNQLHRSEVDSGDRAQARQPRSGSPRARVL